MRTFLLIVGGICGFILALGAIWRAVLWKDVLFGGMTIWQGESSWQLWYCAYAELIGLALMFGSLLLARSGFAQLLPSCAGRCMATTRC